MVLSDQVRRGLASQMWNLRSFWMPPELATVPTMLTAEECRMLAWVTQHVSEGKGAVIDLGSFLGGSTAHLAYGLSQANAEAHVDAFDQFTIADEHKDMFLYKWGKSKLEGNDMQHLFKEFVEPFGKVKAHKCNIEDVVWTGGQIDLLFVDICKSWDATFQVMRQFYPALIPGESLVIHQDYQHFQQPWVPATTYALKDKFDLVSYTQENSAIFICKSKISQLDIEDTINLVKNHTFALRLLRNAAEEFPFARQREAMWYHVQALEHNPEAKNSWDLRLD